MLPQSISFFPKRCACGCGQPIYKTSTYRRGHHLHMITNESRFLRRVGDPNEFGCHLWTGSLFPNGYGQFCVDGSSMGAHRYSYELHKGPLAPGTFACHTCDVFYPLGDPTYKRCVNPNHLFEGTNSENQQDSYQKGRAISPVIRNPECIARGDRSGARLHPETHIRGERVNTCKLTADQVREIRQRHGTGQVSGASLGREYGVTTTAISMIVLRKNWKHIND